RPDDTAKRMSDKHLRTSTPTLELRPGRPEVAEVVDGHSYRREREHLKLLVEQPLQVILGGEADGHMRVELRASFIRHKGSHVVDSRFINVGVFLRGDEGCCRPSLHDERRNG